MDLLAMVGGEFAEDKSHRATSRKSKRRKSKKRKKRKQSRRKSKRPKTVDIYKKRKSEHNVKEDLFEIKDMSPIRMA